MRPCIKCTAIIAHAYNMYKQSSVQSIDSMKTELYKQEMRAGFP